MARLKADLINFRPSLGKESSSAKKTVEEMELRAFLQAYEKAVGEELQLRGCGERPDFECSRPDRSLVGVEITKVGRDSQSKFYDEAILGLEHMDAFEALQGIYYRIYDKEFKPEIAKCCVMARGKQKFNKANKRERRRAQCQEDYLRL